MPRPRGAGCREEQETHLMQPVQLHLMHTPRRGTFPSTPT